jgi:hypothetical protein
MESKNEDQTAEAVILIEQFLEKVQSDDIDINDEEIYEIRNSAIDKIIRIKNELKSNLYFLIVIGGVKSGKSSLINVLSGKKIATTKLGVETTNYPSIVSYGDKDEIVIYRKQSTCEITNSMNLMDMVIDDIKRFDNSKKILEANLIDVLTVDLTEQNIEKFVATSERDSGIILINIRVNSDEESIVKKNISIVDTPGIDGIKSSVGGIRNNNEGEENESKHGINGDEIGKMLVSRSDYMLFMQSSITPLTFDGIKFIGNIGKDTKRKTILVHNKFSINHWRKEQEDTQKQTAPTIKLFKKLSLDVNPITVDIGKAQDVIFKENLKDEESYNNLWNDSNVESLKNDIISSIEQNGKKNHLKNQIEELEKTSNKTRESIRNIKLLHSNKIKIYSKDLSNSFDSIIKAIDNISSTQITFRETIKNPENATGYKSDTFKDYEFDKFIIAEIVPEPKPEKLRKDSFNGTSGWNDFLKKEIARKHNQKISAALDTIKFQGFINCKQIFNIENEVVNINNILEKLQEGRKCSKFYFPTEKLNSIKREKENISDFEPIQFESKGKINSMTRVLKTITPFVDNTLAEDKDYFDVNKTTESLKIKCSDIERELKTSSETMEKILYDSVRDYKTQIEILKTEIINDFESKYFQDEIKEIEIVDHFNSTLNTLYNGLKNVK